MAFHRADTNRHLYYPSQEETDIRSPTNTYLSDNTGVTDSESNGQSRVDRQSRRRHHRNHDVKPLLESYESGLNTTDSDVTGNRTNASCSFVGGRHTRDFRSEDRSIGHANRADRQTEISPSRQREENSVAVHRFNKAPVSDLNQSRGHFPEMTYTRPGYHDVMMTDKYRSTSNIVEDEAAADVVMAKRGFPEQRCRLNRHRSLEYIRELKRHHQQYRQQNDDDRQLVRSKSVMAERDVREHGNDVEYSNGGRDDVYDFFPSNWNEVSKYVKKKLPSMDMPVGNVQDKTDIGKNMDRKHVRKQTQRNPEPDRSKLQRATDYSRASKQKPQEEYQYDDADDDISLSDTGINSNIPDGEAVDYQGGSSSRNTNFSKARAFFSGSWNNVDKQVGSEPPVKMYVENVYPGNDPSVVQSRKQSVLSDPVCKPRHGYAELDNTSSSCRRSSERLGKQKHGNRSRYRDDDDIPLDDSERAWNATQDDIARYGNDVRGIRGYYGNKRKTRDNHRERQPPVDMFVESVDDVDSESSISGYRNTDRSMLVETGCMPRQGDLGLNRTRSKSRSSRHRLKQSRYSQQHQFHNDVMTPIVTSRNGSKMPEYDTKHHKRNINYGDSEFRESQCYCTDTTKKYGKERQPLLDTSFDNRDDLDSEDSASGYLNTDQSLLAEYACNPRHRDPERYSERKKSSRSFQEAKREHRDGYRKIDVIRLENSGSGSSLKADQPTPYGNDVSYDDDNCRKVRHYSADNRKIVDRYHRERHPPIDMYVDNVDNVDTENSTSGYQRTDQSVESMSTLGNCASDTRLTKAHPLKEATGSKKDRSGLCLSDVQLAQEVPSQDSGLVLSVNSGQNADVTGDDVNESKTESETTTGTNYLNIDGKDDDDDMSSDGRKYGARRRRNRLPSMAMFDVDLNSLDPELRKNSLPECQMRHRRMFAKSLINIRTTVLLPSNTRNLVDGKDRGILDAWKREIATRWNSLKEWTRSNFGLWHKSIKCIEGAYGSGVVAYFLFVRRLCFLNLLAFIPLAFFVILPQLIGVRSYTDNVNYQNDTIQNSTNYNSDLAVKDVPLVILDFLQGTGWMTKSFLFYGHYSRTSLYIGEVNGFHVEYALPQAYFVVNVIVFVLSLQRMAKHIASGYRVLILQFDSKSTKYSNMVLDGWDYSLNSVTMVNQKHCSLYLELMALLLEDEEQERKATRSGDTVWILTIERIVINFVVLCTLAASGYAIYGAVRLSVTFPYGTRNRFIQLAMEYLPSMTITALNLVVPPFFDLLAKGEDFSPEVNIHVSLARIVFLRLASLAMLLGTLYVEILCEWGSCHLECWETYVGQQLYKLVVLDFGVVFAKVAVDFCRRLIVDRVKCKLTRMAGKGEFMIPREVLNVLYSQTLCWLGLFFCPLLPAITAMKYFILFHLKTWTCVHNLVPPPRPFRAAKSQLFFMCVLSASFVLCSVPLGYTIFKIRPSTNCGPFREYNITYQVIYTPTRSWSPALRILFDTLTSVVVLLPIGVMLGLLVYYYNAVANARKQMLNLMREQLSMERHDKKFLLRKLNEAIGTSFL